MSMQQLISSLDDSFTDAWQWAKWCDKSKLIIVVSDEDADLAKKVLWEAFQVVPESKLEFMPKNKHHLGCYRGVDVFCYRSEVIDTVVHYRQTQNLFTIVARRWSPF